MSTTPICSGSITIGNDGQALCSTGWEIAAYVAPFHISQLDPVAIASYIGSGFFVLVPIWAAVVGCRALLDAIKPY